MKALVYHRPGKIQLEEKPRPRLEQPTDCLVKITKFRLKGSHDYDKKC